MRLPIASLGGARPALLAIGLLASQAAPAATQASEIGALRQELATLQDNYQTRVADLEARLAVAERRLESAAADARQAVTTAQASAAPAAGPAFMSTAGNPGGGNDFNPAIGVILQGQAWSYRRDPDDYAIPGFPLGGEAGPVPEGLALGESEIDMSANVDDLFTAWLTTPVVIEDGEASIEIEEAWVETLGLPGGISARMGRFFSNFGYLNSKHAHTWDFVDQPLAYQAFLGSQYLDDGLQVRWLAPLPLYVELGAEVLGGDRYPAGGAANDGVGSQTLFAHVGGDVGFSHSWQAGLSYLHAESDARESGAEDDPLVFSGDTDLVGVDFVWKWSPNGNWRERNFVFQSEALWRREDGDYLLPGAAAAGIDSDQFGWYAQAVYQPIPQWRVGARFDLLDSDDPGPAFAGTPLEPLGSDPRRYTVMVDWSHSEFSRLRLQYSHDQARLGADDQWGLQYIFSMGAHGAHTF